MVFRFVKRLGCSSYPTRGVLGRGCVYCLGPMCSSKPVHQRALYELATQSLGPCTKKNLLQSLVLMCPQTEEPEKNNNEAYSNRF